MRLRGRYERIYPLPDTGDEKIPDPLQNAEIQAHYDYLIACAKEVWSESKILWRQLRRRERTT